MKGFIRILEAVIASVILLSAFYAFMSPIKARTEWNEAFLQNQAEDALASMYKSNLINDKIISNDMISLYNKIKNMVPAATDFSGEISGIPNPVIGIGCVDCSAGDKDYLKNALAPLDFGYKNRVIKIIIGEKTGMPELIADNNTNIIYFRDFGTLDINSGNLEAAVRNSKTLFLFSDITESQASKTYMSLFGIRWKSGAMTDTGSFANQDNEKSPSFRINNYFVKSFVRVNTPSPSRQGDLYIKNKHQSVKAENGPCAKYGSECKPVGGVFVMEGENVMVSGIDSSLNYIDFAVITRSAAFEGFSTGSNINHIEPNDNTIIRTADGFSLANANRSLSGRTVWVAKYSNRHPSDTDQLLRAAMLWASGERFSINPLIEIPKTQPLYKYGYIGILDGYEVYEMKLIVWRIFY